VINAYVADDEKNLGNLSLYAKELGLYKRVMDLMEVMLNGSSRKIIVKDGYRSREEDLCPVHYPPIYALLSFFQIRKRLQVIPCFFSSIMILLYQDIMISFEC
jgi:hypothetical protein